MNERQREIAGRYKVCGVIGDPIAHTLSPVIHNKLAEAEKLESVYVPFHVKPSNLEEAIKGAYALNIQGLNVTMPHKQELFKYITHIDQSAKMIGAINTLVYSNEGYIGYNTDYTGLKMSLIENGIEWKEKNVAIIGSGGAAYAAYASVAKEAYAIHLFNRTTVHAQALKEHMAQYFNTPAYIHEMTEKHGVKADIIIQTTGLGMGNHTGKMPECAGDLLKGAEAAVDLIYHPKETLFLSYAKSMGCTVVNGFGMLFYQAAEAFELMHHISCNSENILSIKREIEKTMEA